MDRRIGNWEEVEEGWFFGVVFGVFDLKEDGRGFGFVAIIIRDV